MKIKIITSLVATLFVANANTKTDTLVVRQPEEVKVITKGDTLDISIVGNKENPAYYYNKMVVVNPGEEETITTSNNVGSGLGWDFSLIEGRNSTSLLDLLVKTQLYAGWNLLLNTPSDMKQDRFKSIEAGIDLLHLAYYHRTDKWWLSLDWGTLFSLYRFKENMMTTATDGTIVMSPYPNGSSSKSSSFRTVSSSLTLMGHYPISKDQSVGLGLVWNSKIMDNCSYKTKYTLPDGSSVTDMNELPIRNNLFSVKAEYMFDNAGFYLRYTPMSTFKKNKAPNFSELNIGVQLRF